MMQSPQDLPYSNLSSLKDNSFEEFAEFNLSHTAELSCDASNESESFAPQKNLQGVPIEGLQRPSGPF